LIICGKEIPLTIENGWPPKTTHLE